jgi:phosphate transport system substrate-binding protein
MYNNVTCVPYAASGIAFVYNLGVQLPENLIITFEVAVGIYNGTITRWTDPAITRLNPNIATSLPNTTIDPLHRTDVSGTVRIYYYH